MGRTPRPLPGEGRRLSLGGDGVRGARAGAGGRVSVGGGGRPRAAPDFSFGHGGFGRVSAAEGEAPARGTANYRGYVLYLQGVTVGHALQS